MIIDKLVQFLTAFLNGVMNLLPTWELPALLSSGNSLGSVMGGINAVFPITTLAACVGILVALQLWIFAYGAVIYVYRLIPFKAS